MGNPFFFSLTNPSLGKELSSDFMFFTLEAESTINVTAASNRNTEIDSQFDFIGVDGELCFHEFPYDVLSIDISKMELCWK